MESGNGRKMGTDVNDVGFGKYLFITEDKDDGEE